MNKIIKNLNFIIIALVFFGISGFASADTTPPPLITSTVQQSLNSGFSVNGFIGLQQAQFNQKISFEGVLRGWDGSLNPDGSIDKSKLAPLKILSDSIVSGIVNVLNGKSVKSADLATGSGEKGLCADINGKVVFCPPDICYGGSRDVSAPGNYTLDLSACPAISITVKVWGAGGGGAGGDGGRVVQNDGGGGGGSGGYVSKVVGLSKTGGNIFSYTVGSHGVGGTDGGPSVSKHPSNGTNGGDSFFKNFSGSINLSAKGGGGGGNASATIFGGTPGTAIGGDTNINGWGGDGEQSPANGNCSYSGGNGGNSISLGNGGAGGTAGCITGSIIKSGNPGNDGSNGTISSGGGGGGGSKETAIGSNYSGGLGGNGGDGRVLITW